MTPTYPGVYIQEAQSPVHPITGVATSIAAFVGYTDQGIDNRAEQLFSFSDFERLFGGLASDSELSYAVQQFFSNGGTEAFVVRVPKHGASAANVNIVMKSASANVWTFYALSSGSWADGNLIIDIDLNGLGSLIPGTILSVAASGTTFTATGSGTQFNTLEVGNYLVFAQDSTHGFYKILTKTGNTTLTLDKLPNLSLTSLPAVAVVYEDNLACNLTVTNLQDGTVESFPDISFDNNAANYVQGILNDPDIGSQQVNVIPPSSFVDDLGPVPTGIVGAPVSLFTVLQQLCGGTAVAGGTGALTSGSSTVTGTIFGSLTAGELVIFDADPNATPYTVKSASGTSLVLTSNYTGPTAATAHAATLPSLAVSAAWPVILTMEAPVPTLAPLPLTVTILAANVNAPQSFAGFAAQLQLALNNALSVALPGASVQVSAVNWWGAPAIRLTGVLPGYPDAVFGFQAPSSGNDLASLLGLATASLQIQNVAHYALGTGDLFPVASGALFPTQVAVPAALTQFPAITGSDGQGLPMTADLIGDQGLFSGIYALEKVDLFNILCIPDATRATLGNPNIQDPTVDPNAIYAAAIAYCDQRRAFLLLDAPPNINTAAAAIDWKSTLLTVNDANGAAYFPRLRLPDPENNYQLRTFAPCGVVAGLYARIDGTRGVWKAPAGTEATLSGVQTMTYKLTDNEQGSINPLGLNCARIFPVYGPVMWGARTLVGADVEANQWKYDPVRRIVAPSGWSLSQTMNRFGRPSGSTSPPSWMGYSASRHSRE